MRANRSRSLILLLFLLAAGAGRCAEPSEEGLHDRAVRASAWVVQNQESGAAVLIDSDDRLLVTNCHVVRDAETVAVIFPQFSRGRLIDDRDYYWQNWQELATTGHVIHRDEQRDLAVIQVDRIPATARSVEVARRTIQPGDAVVRVGSPGANGDAWNTVKGVVQFVRMHRLEYRSGQVVCCRMLEDDSPSGSGHSGAAVLNAEGKLVAIHAAGDDASGLSLAVDVSVVRQFLKEARAKMSVAAEK